MKIQVKKLPPPIPLSDEQPTSLGETLLLLTPMIVIWAGIIVLLVYLLSPLQ